MATTPQQGAAKLSPSQLLDSLDAEQRRVATSLSGPLCVLAGAGTGKTRAITYRIAYGIATGKLPERGILAVTFTVRAAAEMRQRLAALGCHGVQVQTFHAAAMRQLKYFWPTAIGGSMPRIIEHKAGPLAAAAARLGLESNRDLIRDYAAEIEWSKVNLIDPADYALTVTAQGRTLPNKLTAREMQSLLSMYEEAKWEQGVLDFEDVLLLTVGMFTDRPDLAAQFRGQYTHFVVDEYQDVSPLQQELLQVWLGNRAELCVVGDVAQTIYSFTGADADYLAKFSERYRGAKTVVLDRDYRSTPQIVEVANQILSTAPGGFPAGAVALRSQKDPGDEVEFQKYSSDLAEAKAIAKQIKAQIENGTPAQNIAILFRTNAQAPLLQRALNEQGLGYVMHGAADFFTNPAVKQTLTRFKSMAAFADESATEVMRNAATASGWSQNPPPTQGNARDTWDALDALVTMCQEYENNGLNPREVAAKLLARSASKLPPTLPRVNLSTLHAAKGLEWDVVHLCGISEGLLPISLAKTPAAIAEERRLLYVGVTRAKSKLSLSYAEARHAGSTARKASRFLAPYWDGVKTAVAAKVRNPREDWKEKAAQFQREASPAARRRYARLGQWRREVARENAQPEYTVLTDASLRQIALKRPRNLHDLGLVKGIGEVKLAHFGATILQLLDEADRL